MDLNADLGEGYGVWRLADDDALLDVVTSGNVACGFHAGDPRTMLRVVNAAAGRTVTIGAQVSYPDLVGFGRRPMDLDAEELTGCVLYQLGALDAFARAAGTRVRYLKPHGALYHRCVADDTQARAVAAATASYDADLAVLTLPGGALAAAAARAGLRFIPEGFADRGYLPAGGLRPRGEAGAVLADPAAAAAQAVRLAGEGQVESICVHSDTPGALAVARAVRAALAQSGFPLGPFCR